MYPRPKYLFGLGLEFEFGLQRIRNLVSCDHSLYRGLFFVLS